MALQASSNTEVSPGACKLLGGAWNLFQVSMKKNLIREGSLLFFPHLPFMYSKHAVKAAGVDRAAGSYSSGVKEGCAQAALGAAGAWEKAWETNIHLKSLCLSLNFGGENHAQQVQQHSVSVLLCQATSLHTFLSSPGLEIFRVHFVVFFFFKGNDKDRVCLIALCEEAFL